MDKKPKRGSKGGAAVRERVTVAFAETEEQAKDYQALLGSNDIEATIKKEQPDPATGAVSFAVMVPEESADEAYVVIESQDAYDDFYDTAVEDDQDEFGADIFEEDF